MSDQFKCRYQVADGYISGKRPQYFSIHASELEEDMTDEDLAKLYDKSMQDHFEQRISPEGDNQEDFVAWARAQLSKRDAS